MWYVLPVAMVPARRRTTVEEAEAEVVSDMVHIIWDLIIIQLQLVVVIIL
jgi:hypothetical protein